MVLDHEEARRIAHSIAFGHAYEKHVSEAGELLTLSSFESLILDTLQSPTKHKALQNRRLAFWNGEESFLVIVNRFDPDMGTAYWPIGGIDGYKVLS